MARTCGALPSPSAAAIWSAFVAAAELRRLDLSPLVPFATFEEFARARQEPADFGAGADADAIEGIMLKRADSIYVPGRPKGLWYKWKRDPFTVDAVLMYAQRGHGKRSSFYSDFTFGVWREDQDGCCGSFLSAKPISASPTPNLSNSTAMSAITP